MEPLTPASADDLPPPGELVADDPFWPYPAGVTREGAAHLRVWVTAADPARHAAAVTETGGAGTVTESAERIWPVLAGRYGPGLVLLEQHLAPGFSQGMETLDLVRRRRWQPALDSRLAGTAGQSPARRARAVDGLLRAPDRQRAREPVGSCQQEDG